MQKDAQVGRLHHPNCPTPLDTSSQCLLMSNRYHTGLANRRLDIGSNYAVMLQAYKVT